MNLNPKNGQGQGEQSSNRKGKTKKVVAGSIDSSTRRHLVWRLMMQITRSFSGKKRASIAIALLLVAIALIVVACLPSILWTPEQVEETVVIGELATVQVSFTSTQDLENVDLRVVPKLAPFLTVAPSSIASISAGQNVTLDLSLSATSIDDVGVYEGVVQLKKGRRTIARPLPVTLTVSVVPLPPDPGEPGKETIAGIDSDGDGVRDDIQRYIALTYPESGMTRAALSQQAAKKQHVLELIEEEDAGVIEAIRNELSGKACLRYLHGVDQASSLTDELSAEVLNTRERFQASQAAERQFSGYSYAVLPSIEGYSECAFDIESMEN